MDLSQNRELEPFRRDVRHFFETEYPQDIRDLTAKGVSLSTTDVRRSSS